MHYIPRNNETVCYIMRWFYSVVVVIISIRVTSLVPGKQYDVASGSKITLKNMGKKLTWINSRVDHNKMMCLSGGT